MVDQNDIDEQYKAAVDFKQEYQGAAVSGLQPIETLAEQFPAGSVQHQKLQVFKPSSSLVEAGKEGLTLIQNFAKQFPTYRRIRGDGNCGWRAVLYQYLWYLLASKEASLVEMEEVRLRSQTELILTLPALAGNADLLEDFIEPMLDTLKSIKVWQKLGSLAEGEAKLSAALEDVSVGSSMIYHLRLLTSAYMRSNSDQFAGFMVDRSVDEYAGHEVEQLDNEIDELGLSALQEVHIVPSGMGLQVYDLNSASKADLDLVRDVPARETPIMVDKGDGQRVRTAVVIRLLFRPTHYDLLGLPATAAA